ncbi:hypothetical protein ACGFMM_30490 [Streptomyces sp. NPDC048604]|uniref:hypothetical protein n=1 Tax=Streptomyces sp. NPDC048604 TaxID=3365578 RepID=UPI00371D9179
MKQLSKLSCVTALIITATAAAATAATAAGPAATQQVDGVIVVAGNTCTWSNARTSANPPTALTIDRTSINTPGGNLSCTGGITATLNNNPAATFDDAAGRATADAIDITVKMSGISCRYKATGVQWNRDGDTRKYLNQAFTAAKTSGLFLCPGSVTIAAGDASLLFH